VRETRFFGPEMSVGASKTPAIVEVLDAKHLKNWFLDTSQSPSSLPSSCISWRNSGTTVSGKRGQVTHSHQSVASSVAVTYLGSECGYELE